MGIILAMFRMQETDEEKLEKLHKKIKSLKARINMGQAGKRNDRWFILILVIVVLLIIIYFFPETLYDGTFCLIALICVPVVCIIAKRILHFHHKQINLQNRIELQSLVEERDELLRNVMETQTYNNARIILGRYPPEE